MFDKKLLEKLYTTDTNNEVVVLSHAGKTWVMPKDAREGAMDIYQPATRKGKMLKKAVVNKGKTPFFARGSKAEIVCAQIKPEIKKQIEELLGIYDFDVAVYIGELWTSQNDKAVFQIYKDKEIYAYVKATADLDNAKKFERESKALNDLRDREIEFAPKSIGLDLDSEVKMFAQSTDKTVGQEVVLEFNNKVLDLAKEMVDKTKQRVDYTESDFYKYVEFLKTQLNIFDKEQQSIIEEAIKQVEAAEISEYAFSHGDYTPWNMYYVKDEIRLFDLEYCSDSMPVYIDIFHYLSQVQLLGKRYTAQCVMREYEHQLDLIKEYVDDPKFTFICYLVWIISFYIKRADKNLDRVREALDVWVEMLEYLIKYL